MKHVPPPTGTAIARPEKAGGSPPERSAPATRQSMRRTRGRAKPEPSLVALRANRRRRDREVLSVLDGNTDRELDVETEPNLGESGSSLLEDAEGTYAEDEVSLGWRDGNASEASAGGSDDREAAAEPSVAGGRAPGTIG